MSWLSIQDMEDIKALAAEHSDMPFLWVQITRSKYTAVIGEKRSVGGYDYLHGAGMAIVVERGPQVTVDVGGIQINQPGPWRFVSKSSWRV